MTIYEEKKMMVCTLTLIFIIIDVFKVEHGDAGLLAFFCFLVEDSKRHIGIHEKRLLFLALNCALFGCKRGKLGIYDLGAEDILDKLVGEVLEQPLRRLQLLNKVSLLL